MKIQAIRISGFRGIPPVKSGEPYVSISMQNGVAPKNLVLFGPNAFGKSSIADALEWFFRGHTRAPGYFDGYRDEDTVHLNLGKPGYPSIAYVELEILHKGQIHKVRRELGTDGQKCGEDLGDLVSEIRSAQDEIVVLDHDQFREFVNAASKEKWQTFSSLIGYEQLDQFRSGMDSLTAKSLTDHLGLTKRKSDLARTKAVFARELGQAVDRAHAGQAVEPSVKALRTGIMRRLEMALASLGLPASSEMSSLDQDYWNQLRARVQPSATRTSAVAQAANLREMAKSLSPIEKGFLATAKEFAESASRLGHRKQHFDKRVLSDLYRLGAKAVASDAEGDRCPLCDSAISRSELQAKLAMKLVDLDFEGIEKGRDSLHEQWKSLQNILRTVSRRLQSHSMSEIRDAFASAYCLEAVGSAIELESYDETIVSQWAEDCAVLVRTMAEAVVRVEEEILKIEHEIGNDSLGRIASEIDELDLLWRTYEKLIQDEHQIDTQQRDLDVATAVAEELRVVASSFREELSDFSGRVVELVNEDVSKYYEVLHPDDMVKPYLEASISGNQRTVTLRCDYYGNQNRDAASLLSESHRNSLGLAILLAFMNYKRRVGSPVEFCVFDDVTQSFDTSHRVNLIGLLEDARFPEVSDQQVLFLTHDRTLADLILRPGEERRTRSAWCRFDMRHWWLDCLVIEPGGDPFQISQRYLASGDEIAGAVYARRALETVLKSIVDKCNIRVQYRDKPWRTNIEDYRTWIVNELTELWVHNEGILDPADPAISAVLTSQQILNLTVHDSEFLDNPMTAADVKAALKIVTDLQALFTCRVCGKQRFHTVKRGKNGQIPNCRLCGKPLL
ncbi:MAG: hypothetical protein ACOX3S_15545 [Anaerolineae bacterium]